MENKLVTLFKQCCDNSDFKKTHNENYMSYNKDSHCKLEDQPLVLSDKVKDMLSSCGYEVKEVGETYNNKRYGRLFEFDGEPPMKLIKASVRLTLLMHGNHISLGPVEQDTWIEKDEYRKKRFWSQKYEYMTRDIPHIFHKRMVTVNSDILLANQLQWKANQNEKSFDFCPRFAHRYEEDSCYIVTSNFNAKKASNYWFNKQKTMMLDSSHNKSNLHNNDNVMSGLQHDHMEINGAILRFGDVWLWLDWEEYQELDNYYKESIKKTHEIILEQRLKETKTNG